MAMQVYFNFFITELSHFQQHVKNIYIDKRFNIQQQLLHPKHFVNGLLMHCKECSRKKGNSVHGYHYETRSLYKSQQFNNG